MKDGTVKQEKEGYSINTDLFPICYSKKKIEAFKAQLDEIRQSMNEEEFSKSPFYPEYKTFYFYYEKGFQGLMIPPEEFVMKLSAGFANKKKGSCKSDNPHIPEGWPYSF